jgi:hypothetical protein
MRIALGCLLVHALCAAAAAGAAEPEMLPLQFVWIDLSSDSTLAYDAARAEAGDVLRAAGVDSQWRRGTAAEVRRDDEVAIVVLPTLEPHSREGHRILGAALKDTTQAPVVWVYAPEVQAALGLARRPASSWTSAERLALGRAIGRVAAHEVVHVLLPGRPHAPSGLMSARLDRTALQSQRLRVDARTAAALRARSGRTMVAARGN